MNQDVEKLAKNHASRYESLGAAIVEAAEFDFKAGYSAASEEIQHLKDENNRIKKIANNNAASCDGLAQEIDRLREDKLILSRDATVEILNLEEENKRLRSALEDIASQTMSMHLDMDSLARHCIKAAKDALGENK